MHATEHPVPISVCVDCLSMLANGTVSDDRDETMDRQHAARMNRMWGGGAEITLGWTEEQNASEGIDPEDDEADLLGFSGGRCDGCGSTLAGDRYAATAWVTD